MSADDESARNQTQQEESEKDKTESNNKEGLALYGSSSRSCEADDEFDDESELDTKERENNN